MKRLMILLAFAGLLAGCARNTENSQGGGGYDRGGSMGTSTNGTNQGTIAPGTGSDTGKQPGSGTATPESQP